MNFSFFIAKRIALNKQLSFSRFIIRLSIGATVFSVAAMIITLALVNGFQQNVSQKVFSFWGHIRVQHFELGKALVAEENPIATNDTVARIILQQPAVLHLQTFATKTAVLEKQKEIEGSLIKGISKEYDSVLLKPYIKEGRWLRFDDSLYSKEIIISEQVAKLLKAHVNDTIRVNFINSLQSGTSYRKLIIAGIYKTGIEDYDKLFSIADIRLIQRINNWQANEIGGYEIVLHDYKRIDEVNTALQLPIIWSSKTIKEVYPNIFDWLNVQDVNRNVIIIVMSFVAIINLITCLLILVLERTRMAGLFKALGATNFAIQKIFLLHASLIAIAGVCIGFIVGIGLCYLQQYTHFIKLDETNYFVSYAPIQIIWWQTILVCIATILICFLALIIPTLLIRNIQPVKAIQFR